MSKKTTYINFVLDESGSMNAVLADTIGGFNAYVDKLREDKKQNIRFTLTQFSSEHCKPSYIGKPLKEVAKLTTEAYRPNGWTPLYDAVAYTIQETENAIKDEKVKPDVLTVILTDGEENASKEFTRAALLKLIESKQADGWTFLYLGANQDAWAVAGSIGIQKGNVAGYAAADTADTFGVAVDASMRYMQDPDPVKRSRLLSND